MNARCFLKVGNMVKLNTNSGFIVTNWVICEIISIPWPVFCLNQHPSLMILEMFVHRVLTCPHHLESLASYSAPSQSLFSIAALNFLNFLKFVRPRLYAMSTMAFCTEQQRAWKVLLPITTSASTMAVPFQSKELYCELLFQKIGGFINGENLQFGKDNIRDGFKRELPVPQGIETGTYAPGDHDYGIVVLVKDDNICVSELNLTKLTRLCKKKGK